MYGAIKNHILATLEGIRGEGFYKTERVLSTPQGARVGVIVPQDNGAFRGEVLVLCANNCLGLAGHPEILAAAHMALDRWGYGLASVRFICGTQQVHKDL